MFWAHDPRDLLLVSGADATTYLQSQISQDITKMSVGESAYTFVLQPNGKVDTLARLTKRGDTEWLVDTDLGFGAGLLARLNRFKIRVKADITELPPAGIAVRGSAAVDGVPAWGRDDAVDLLEGEAPAGVRAGSAAELLAARIEAGWPAMGREITDMTIPAESGVVAFAVSFTKGCYPGQELVERMDSRGSQAPRFVRRLRGSGAEPAEGAEVSHDGKPSGHLTSVAATEGGWIALGVVARAVEPGAVVSVAGAGSATVEPL